MFAYYMRRDSYKQCIYSKETLFLAAFFLDKIFCTLN